MARWYAEARDKTYYMMNFSCQVLLNYFSLASLICAAETVNTVQKRSKLCNLSDGASGPVQRLRGVAAVDRR